MSVARLAPPAPAQPTGSGTKLPPMPPTQRLPLTSALLLWLLLWLPRCPQDLHMAVRGTVDGWKGEGEKRGGVMGRPTNGVCTLPWLI